MAPNDDWTSDCGFATKTDSSNDTSATNEIRSVRTNPYCTVITYISSNTETEYDRERRKKWEDQQFWMDYFIWAERQEELRELSWIDRRIKRKVNLPIIPKNIINKTMNRRMMNGRH